MQKVAKKISVKAVEYIIKIEKVFCKVRSADANQQFVDNVIFALSDSDCESPDLSLKTDLGEKRFLFFVFLFLFFDRMELCLLSGDTV